MSPPHSQAWPISSWAISPTAPGCS
jgi:hypothetical protein